MHAAPTDPSHVFPLIEVYFENMLPWQEAGEYGKTLLSQYIQIIPKQSMFTPNSMNK